jgi:hypothetical protein
VPPNDRENLVVTLNQPVMESGRPFVHVLTFLTVFRPGLIVGIGARYGTHLLWLLLPICCFIQEMVVRLGIARARVCGELDHRDCSVYSVAASCHAGGRAPIVSEFIEKEEERRI